MFSKRDEHEAETPAPGVRRATLCHGERTLMTEFRLTAGSALPLHAHPHEQTGYLVSGRLRLTVGGRTHDAGPGDSWCIPGDVEHGAAVLDDAVAVEVFSPVRVDYLPAGSRAVEPEGRVSGERDQAPDASKDRRTGPV